MAWCWSNAQACCNLHQAIGLMQVPHFPLTARLTASHSQQDGCSVTSLGFALRTWQFKSSSLLVQPPDSMLGAVDGLVL